MAVLVIDLLEMIDVDHRERERVLKPPRPLHLFLENPVELAPVEQSCELIVRRELAEGVERFAQLERVPQRALDHPRGDFAFDEEIQRAGIHRLHIDAMGGLGGQKHDWRPATPLRRLVDELQAIALAELVIEQARRVRAGAEFLDPLVVRRRPSELVVAGLEILEMRLRDPELQPVVVDQEDLAQHAPTKANAASDATSKSATPAVKITRA